MVPRSSSLYSGVISAALLVCHFCSSTQVSFLQFLREPLVGELLQFADLVHLGEADLLDEGELTAGVHHLQLRLGVLWRGEDEDHGEADAAVAVVDAARVDDEARLVLRQRHPQLVNVIYVFQLLVHEHRVGVRVYLQYQRSICLFFPEPETFDFFFGFNGDLTDLDVLSHNAFLL